MRNHRGREREREKTSKTKKDKKNRARGKKNHSINNGKNSCGSSLFLPFSFFPPFFSFSLFFTAFHTRKGKTTNIHILPGGIFFSIFERECEIAREKS